MENQNQEIRHEKLNDGLELYQGKVTIYANQFSNVLWLSNSGLSINQLDEIINRNYDKVYVEYVTYEKGEYVVITRVFKKYYTMVELAKVENINKLEKVLDEYGVSKYTKRRVLKVVKGVISDGKVRIYVYPNRITVETPRDQFIDFKYRKA
jgi:DNA-directed RNA polymerase subunit N (RpoN/RPB10)